MIVAISGKLGSGKDTIGQIIQCLTEDNLTDGEIFEVLEGKLQIPNPDWQIKKMAGKLKEIASLILGVPVEKFEDRDYKESYLPDMWNYTDKNGFKKQMTVREFLQRLGTDAMRDGLHPNTWANAFWSDYRPLDPENAIDELDYSLCTFPNWIITDVRFPNEAQSVKERDSVLIRVNRGGDTGNHPSETALDDWEDWDYVIDNNRTIDHLIDVVKGILIKEQIL